MKNITIKKRENMTIFLLLASVWLLAGCHNVQEVQTEKVLSYQESYEITGEEKEELIRNLSPTILDTSDRNNSEAEEIVIETVEQEGTEVTVPSGRYQIWGSDTGLVVISDDNDQVLLREIVGYGGVPSITADLSEKHTIHFYGGFDQAGLTPVPTLMNTELTTGVWEVGIDIKADNYLISGSSGLGYLEVFNPDGKVDVYEIVVGGFGSSKSNVHLEDGQKLRITGVPSILFNRE
ncbi:hypothetical protein [Oceanobacillus bengalensis]|uniref:Lipoprotein n=1 Tax=Oceanobacillus bengalensis TaxID=1435466 RepID=A0A494Z5L3_9BACI|nr:hypothetical protein [Oceanobacillus bengalensis]RKQ17606.1 hypothetical protein D8M05_04190 [Oceanobacillus bengalensis]